MQIDVARTRTRLGPAPPRRARHGSGARARQSSDRGEDDQERTQAHQSVTQSGSSQNGERAVEPDHKPRTQFAHRWIPIQGLRSIPSRSKGYALRAVRLKSNGSQGLRPREPTGAARWLDQDEWLGSDTGSSPSNSALP